ncbi:hypothetical protein Tsubulata_048670 [Turnera subulata]|uniref:Cell differentiation protein rcd1 n=1 Tax=Turnera subulata TaxID=218843 RepID=A0A9Q0JFF8_9ROSI|nr:hypothetical protein Tsubulata_048670 [Turnera subulata]
MSRQQESQLGNHRATSSSTTTTRFSLADHDFVVQWILDLQDHSKRELALRLLALCIALHPRTKKELIKANLTAYIYPFLNNRNQEGPHEHIRIASLGVIGALVKVIDTEVIRYLLHPLNPDVIPGCINCMEVGSELSKTVATFIINQIIITEEGMRYCCVLPERFYAMGFALGNMVEELIKGGRLAEHSAKRLLKHIICCYERLSQYPR